MPIYHQEPENDSPETIKRRPYQSFACGLLHIGAITIFRDRQVLDEAVEKLRAEEFDIRRLDTAGWTSDDAVFTELGPALGLPAEYVSGLDALASAMQDLQVSDEGGLVLVLTNFDEFARREADFVKQLLDVLARGSRFLQIFGKTLLVLVQIQDPDVETSWGYLGGSRAALSEYEFLAAFRRARGE